MDTAPWFDNPDLFDPRRIQLADIDGSGTTDIIYLGCKGVDLYFNQSGNGWSKPHHLDQFPQIDSLSSVAVMDLLGNGTACLVWSSPLPGNGRRPMRYVDLMGGQKPPADKDLTKLNTKDLPTDPLITVQAVLSWSEYYNGKWQPTKTSDVNRPTSLASYVPVGPRETGRIHVARFDRQFGPVEFDRSELRLSVWQISDGLSISITGQGSSSFFLYNTHSLPLRGEDGTPTGFDPRHRDFDTSTNTFTIRYYSGMGGEPPTREILQNALPDSIITPQHPLQNSWDAPYFYEDSRHVFYVTTTDKPVFIPDGEYGVHLHPGIKQIAKIPPLVLKIDPEVGVKPTLWGDGGPIGPDPSVIDPGPMKRLVTEDAYIHQGIGMTAVVMYGDKKIEPSGAVMNIQAGK
jgi:hypothetical protein